MCGRYTLEEDPNHIVRHYKVSKAEVEGIHANYNVAPTQTMPVVIKQGEQLSLVPMRWGIHRVIGPNIEKDIINTRADKSFSRFWGKTIRENRCLVPANGFYEWKTTDEGKVPHYIHLKDNKLYSFAGIYAKDADGRFTFSIMTTEPNKEMKPIHNRMPVILSPDEERLWLDPSHSEDQSFLEDLLQPLEDGLLELYPVSKEVNNVRNNRKELTTAL